MLSGYRIMWMMAIFDLPVASEKDRKAYSRFRNDLLDLGFEMVQFSVYMKHVSGRAQANALTAKVRSIAPPEGDVKIIAITDKQFSRIIHLGKRRKKPPETEQLLLF